MYIYKYILIFKLKKYIVYDSSSITNLLNILSIPVDTWIKIRPLNITYKKIKSNHPFIYST